MNSGNFLLSKDFVVKVSDLGQGKEFITSKNAAKQKFEESLTVGTGADIFVPQGQTHHFTPTKSMCGALEWCWEGFYLLDIK
jgi:hypothetical protein